MNELDTYSMTNVGNLDCNSSLLNQSEARSMRSCPNINVIIAQSREEGKISHFIENAKHDFPLN